MQYNISIKREVNETMYTIQASGDGWKVTRPSGVVMHLETLRYALFLTDGEPRQVLDKQGYLIA